jgi:serine/threonine-protein kinase
MDTRQGTILSNRYLIAEEIGMGGMGNVYRATDLRTGADVAVKIPHAFLARNPEYMERLRREAQIAASVYSPRVVRVMDLDVHDGTPYLVMEYVPGDTLADVLHAQGRFSLPDTLSLGLEVARALEAAHAKGIVHRDLKPQNIKLVDGEVKVLDFGIAKAEGFANVTAASVFMGTPEYCAPERAEGLGDIRSDIYSLAVIMFEMYEGRLPFQGATPLALMKKHESEPPPPFSGEVSPAVQEILATCLAKQPEDRYQSPRELVQALRAVLEAPGVHTPAATPKGVAPTLQHALPREPDPTTPTVPMGSGPSPTGTAVAARPATVPPFAPPPTTVPAPPRRRGPPLLIAGVLLVLVLGAATLAAVLLTRGSGNGGEDGTDTPMTATTSAGGAVTPGPSAATATPVPTPSPPRLLLTPGERVSLESVPAIEVPIPGCSPAKSILRLTSMQADADGKMTIGFTFEAPRVAGATCPIVDYPADANCCSVLVTRRAAGPPVEARVSGGSGLAMTGAEDVYGKPALAGTWVFPGVELDGEDLTLKRFARNEQNPFGGDLLFQVVLLQRR